MQNPFETMALNFTNAIKYLEQPLENLQKSSYREFHLQNIKLVLSKSMPLKEPVLRKIILLIIHNFTSKKLLETEIILLLENLEFLFRNYDFQIYSKIFFEEKEICALIITQLLACLQVFNFNFLTKKNLHLL